MDKTALRTALLALAPRLVIYSGWGGQIVSAALLDSGAPFLHLHSGWLPTSTWAPRSANCARCPKCRSVTLSGPGRRLSKRQTQGGDKAALRMVSQLKLTAMPFGGATSNGQSQAMTAAGLPRRAEERLA